MKKLACIMLVLALGLSLCVTGQAATIGAPDFEVTANGVYLINLDTDTVIYEKEADTPMSPASLTKIMTCILALELTEDLDGQILTYSDAVQDWLYNYQYVQGNGEVSKGGLMAGEQLPMRQMLYALMLPSANEAAMIIAEHLGGTQAGFAQMMNDRAKELGCRSTNFVNPNGLYDDAHRTTPRDMAIITRHAMTLPGFMDIVTTSQYVYGPTNIHNELVWNNTNQMMVEGNDYYYAPVRGVKTGSLPEAGYCFASTATRDGFTYLLVIMGAPYLDSEGNRITENGAFRQTREFYSWVFDNYKSKRLVEKGKNVKEIPLRLSMERDYLNLMTEDSFSALVPVNVEASSVTMRFQLPESVDAPVEKGQEIGKAVLILAGEEIGEVTLLAAETISASTPLVILERIKAITGSFWFKFILVFVLLLLAAYITLMVLRNRNRRRSGYRPRRRL